MKTFGLTLIAMLAFTSIASAGTLTLESGETVTVIPNTETKVVCDGRGESESGKCMEYSVGGCVNRKIGAVCKIKDGQRSYCMPTQYRPLHQAYICDCQK